MTGSPLTSALLILALAGVTFLIRVAGFALVGRTVPAGFDRFLRFVPVAAFAALAAPDLVLVPAPGLRLAAALAAALVTVLTRRLELGLVAGLLAFFALRLVAA